MTGNKKSLKIAMIILAAGESKRMGRIKQILPWKNSTLLEHVIEQGHAATVDDVFVVLGANIQSILNKIDQNNITIINNQKWQEGMGTSIASAMHYFKKNSLYFDAVLIALVDQPLLDLKHYNILINNYIKLDFKIISTLLKSRAGVPAIFDRKYFSELATLDQDFGAKKIIATNSHDVYTTDSDASNVDLDTIEIYNSLFNTYGR